MSNNILKLHRDYMEFIGFEGLVNEGTFSVLSTNLAVYVTHLPMQNNQEPFNLISINDRRICTDKFMLYEIKNMFGINPEDEYDLTFKEMPYNNYISVEKRKK